MAQPPRADSPRRTPGRSRTPFRTGPARASARRGRRPRSGRRVARGPRRGTLARLAPRGVRLERGDDEGFRKTVAALRQAGLDTAQLSLLARDADLSTSRIALAALADRDDLPAEWQAFVLSRLEHAPYDQAGLLLRTLARVPAPVLAGVLSHLDDVLDRDVVDLIAARAATEPVDADLLREVPLRLAPDLQLLVDGYGHLLPDSFADAIDSWRTTNVDVDFL